MGIIDKVVYHLTCSHCGTEESQSITDHGSIYSESSWGCEAVFTKFKTKWIGGGKKEPKLETAICNTCGKPATINNHYQS